MDVNCKKMFEDNTKENLVSTLPISIKALSPKTYLKLGNPL